MNFNVPTLGFQLFYLFTHLSWTDVADMALVAVVFFVIFQALRYSQALQLVQGALILSVLALSLLTLLPLTTFSWVLRGLLVAGIIVLPLIFQDELKRTLLQLGRLGQRRTESGSAFDRLKKSLAIATTQLSNNYVGALIVLEGFTSLDDIIQTGIPIHAKEITPELLITIFQEKTPLHDGAVVIRNTELKAAGCILPLHAEKTEEKHLGTRHRAALGLTKRVPDALVIVVSEETGHVSIAHIGELERGVASSRIFGLLTQFEEQLGGRMKTRWDWLRGISTRFTTENLLTSLALAVVAWTAVTFQFNPPQQVDVSGVPIEVNQPEPGLLITNTIPSEATVQIQTTQNRAEAISFDNVKAEVDLSGLEPDAHRVPVKVTLLEPQDQVVSVSPSFVDVTIESEEVVLLEPTIQVQDPESIPPGYARGNMMLEPQEVQVKGPENKVEQVEQLQAVLLLEGRRRTFQTSLDMVPVDKDGNRLQGLRLNPPTVLVTVPIERVAFSREISIQADLAGSLPNGYQITQVQISPSTVTLLGDREVISGIEDFLSTGPIELNNVRDDFEIDVPLIVPEGVRSLDQEGETVTSVTVAVSVEPVADYLVMNMEPELVGIEDPSRVTLEPARLTVLLIGPQPLLEEIQVNRDLVSLSVDLEGFIPGSYTVEVQVSAPSQVGVELFPADVRVTLEGLRE